MRGHVNSAERNLFEQYKMPKAGNLKLPALNNLRS